MNEPSSRFRTKRLPTPRRVGVVDLWQARTVANVFLFVVATVLATNYFGTVAIWFLVCTTTLAVSLGRAGVLVLGLPVAVVASHRDISRFAREWSFEWSFVDVNDLFVAGLAMAFIAIAFARLELGTTNVLKSNLKASRVTEGERYRLRINLSLFVSPLIAALLSLIVLHWLPFRSISQSDSGLIRPTTRMLILVWGLGATFLICNVLFRLILWRRQSPMQARMYVLQTLGDGLGAEQQAIERKRSAIAKKRERRASSAAKVTVTRRNN
ncbi:MAG TPA: hypothetical protein EYQ75_13350 [Planctomycetaceae bacterium]|nr:hypothetical protein [Planctomycetaceae bacterium]